MSRIIAGLAGSVKLKTAAKATRPTSDRVKESVFAKLESLDVLENAKVLDLYSGTAALGLEAASRGAKEVVLVERDKAALEVIRANVEQISKSLETTQISIQPIDVAKYLATSKGAFDLVFVDPPYDLEASKLKVVLELLGPLLSPEGLVLVERSSRESMFELPAPWELLETKTYGDTAVHFLSFAR